MDSRTIAADALNRGEQARRENRLEDARSAFDEAAGLFRALGADPELAHALTRQAQIERDSGAIDAAARYQEEALGLDRSVNPAALPHVIRHLADMLVEAGRPHEASPLYREMLELYDARDDVPPLEMTNALRSMAVHAEACGDKYEARRLWSEARERYAALDDLFCARGVTGNPGVEEANERLSAL